MEMHTLTLIVGGFVLGVVLMAGLLLASVRPESEERESGSEPWESDDIITDPVFAFMSCNVFHSDDE